MKILLPFLLIIPFTGRVGAVQTVETKILKEDYQDCFKIGATLSSFDISHGSRYKTLILEQFNAISSGTELKPEFIRTYCNLSANIVKLNTEING